jgi:hypothetical protein
MSLTMILISYGLTECSTIVVNTTLSCVVTKSSPGPGVPVNVTKVFRGFLEFLQAIITILDLLELTTALSHLLEG